MTDGDIIQYVSVNIIMDFVYYGTGVAGATVFSSVVGAAAGVNLYSDIKIGDTVISTSKVFAIFRVIVLIVLLTFNISWATLGTSTTIDNYLLYRRAGYIFSLCVVVFVTVPLLVYFSNNVLRLMMDASRAERGTGELTKTTIKETNYASNFASEIEIVPNSHPPSGIDVRSPSTRTRKTKVPRISIKPLKTAKRATIAEKIANFRFAINTALKKIMANSPNYLLDICDYRANYLGCGSLINQFALIDLIMILLATGTTALYIAKIIQNVMTKVWSKHEGKKWSPLDTTLVLCFSSNIFRIIQLANARSLSYRNISQMSDEEIIRYVQINIIMDFVYYSMGVFGSTSSVVGAAAGVNLYSDVKIGQTVIPTNKVFAVLRVIILVLLLTFNILWATLGTTTSRDAYITYRRAGFLISLLVIVFITSPLLIYFSNRVIDILRNSSASDKGTKSSRKASKSAPNNTFKMDEADFPMSVVEDTPPVKIENPKLSVKTVVRKSNVQIRNNLETKIFNFRFAINTTIWLLYFLTACNLVLLIVGGEVSYFLQNPTALLYFKGLSDFSVWVSCSFMLLYLYIC
ncbi:hypothetical protein HK103_006087 [Boothiomyces macroporosus]|uniref:Uncharacterized protein n=1 Tax=Boothiomyces macroporosus TaxID=261099 RepID=A0AAD5UHG1_9FUNG|nr:hypothetical protein HK103_006087 [Boothiomyces macroporosus]